MSSSFPCFRPLPSTTSSTYSSSVHLSLLCPPHPFDLFGGRTSTWGIQFQLEQSIRYRKTRIRSVNSPMQQHKAAATLFDWQVYIIYLTCIFSVPLTVSSLRNTNACDRINLPSSQSLRPDQITVLINGYSESRIPLIHSIAASYAASPLISAVLVLWGNPSTPQKTLSHLSNNFSLIYTASGIPITVHRQKTSSLNSRFLPRNSILTRGVLISDDDIEVDSKSVEFAFKIWEENQDRLIGFFARSHDLDLISKTWIYTVHPDRYSIILTKFMILKAEYLYQYSCKEELSGLRNVVEEMNNCEDILMNFVVADAAEQGPLLVKAERVRDWGDARNEGGKKEEEIMVGLSSLKRGGGEHRKRRGECIKEFHRILGRMPLRYSHGKVVNSIGEQGLCEKGGKLVPCDEQMVID